MSTNIQKKAKDTNVKSLPNSKQNNEFVEFTISEAEKAHILKNLNKFPYRGGMTHIAKKRNVTRNAIFISLRSHNNMEYLALIKQYGDKRRQNIGLAG